MEDRIQSVDLFRAIAIIAVISIHSSPFRSDLAGNPEIYKTLFISINTLARFGVPFFFVIAGYFFGIKIRRGVSPMLVANSVAKRIVLLFVFWCLVYLHPLNLDSIVQYGFFGPIKVVFLNLFELLKEDPVKFFLQGSKGHLWFLPALLISIYCCAFLIIVGWEKGMLPAGVLLYLFGVLAGAYANTPLGIEISINTRNGPFFGTIFFATGYYLSGIKRKASWLRYGIGGFLLGLFLHSLEIYILSNYFNTSPRQNYVVGTYLMGTGVALASLSAQWNISLKLLSNLGKMTLGIYAIHYIFIDLFYPFDKQTDAVLWEIGYVVLVFFLSSMVTTALSRIRLTRRFVL